MLTLADYNLIPILIALLIGLVTAFWIVRSARVRPTRDERLAPPAAPSTPYRRPRKREGDGVPDEFAAATRDVAGEILGVEAHPDIPGPGGPPDDLKLLKGVGPKLAAQLKANGITRYAQLAGLTDNEVAMLDARMGAFDGRIARDRLVEQACYLQRGDTDGFEAKFGKLGG
jgi:predicted flap endonuclease-1-like 5' DNA nuclease